MCGKPSAPAAPKPPPPLQVDKSLADRGSSAPTSVDQARRVGFTESDGIKGGLSGSPDQAGGAAPVVKSVLGG